MSIVELQDWASVAAIIAVGLTLLTTSNRRFERLDATIDRTRAELKTEIAEARAELGQTRTELKSDIADLRNEVKAEFGRVDARLQALEHRTYDLSTRLPAASA